MHSPVIVPLSVFGLILITSVQCWPTPSLPLGSSPLPLELNLAQGNSTGPKNGQFMLNLISNIFSLLNLKQVIKDIEESRSTETSCYACKFGMALAQHFIEYGKGANEMGRMAYKICTILKIEDPKVCRGIVNVYKDEFVTVIAKVALSPNEICGVLLGPKCAEVYNPWHNWTLPLTPYPKPPPRPPQPERRYLGSISKILHLSDTHIDLKYAHGGDAECGEPLCCRDTTKAIPHSRQSGYWGDYRNCDVPLRTLQAMLKEIRRNHRDIDYVIWTGDIPPHDIWSQNRAGQLSLLRKVSAMVNQYLGDVPIYPALGNHESVPVNSFPPPNIKGSHSISWLYDTLTEVWGQFLPKETLKTIKKGGYYSAMVKPNLKLISLNMNYCNNQNWWLLLNSTDPADELTWLIKELQTAELLDYKVHIIGHIPPGSNDCLSVWSRNYYRIVNRYESTITGQFFGHTHQDEFLVFYDQHDLAIPTKKFSDYRATSVAYVGPSVTTFGGVNPGYRIYWMADNRTKDHGISDEDWNYQIVNHQTFYLNLTEANKLGINGTIDWKLSYTPRSAYGMANLDPISWHRLVLDMARDEKIFSNFYKNFFVQSDYIQNKPCNRVCKVDLLCRMISAHSHDPAVCGKFLLDSS